MATDNWSKARNLLGGAGKIVGWSVKQAFSLTIDGLRPEPETHRRVVIPRRTVPRQNISRPIPQKNMYARGRKASSKVLMSNPFPRNISEELGIPHREQISEREYELIRKDMIRKGLH